MQGWIAGKLQNNRGAPHCFGEQGVPFSTSLVFSGVFARAAAGINDLCCFWSWSSFSVKLWLRTSPPHFAGRLKKRTELQISRSKSFELNRQCLETTTMATNGATNRKGEDDGMIHVTDDKMGGNLSYVKTGMTISPELFEKV
jgi:hypothetical protein